MASDNSKSGVAPEGDSTAVLFIKTLFGDTTEHPVFVCSLPNTSGDPNEPGPRQTLTRDGDKLATFAQRWDRRGRGLFFCVGTVTAGQRRAKDTILETVGLWTDIDFKAVDADEPTIREKVRELQCPPSVVVRSGHGLHYYWLFKEGFSYKEMSPTSPTESASNQERIEAALRQLADLVAGDLAVAEVSRLMRLPGSHNSKGGAWIEVVCEFTDGPRYELDDLEEWLSETAPVLRRKGATPTPVEGGGSNPFLEAARLSGYKLPLDVEQAIANMTFGNIHSTQLSVSASLLNAGEEVDGVVAQLLSATRAAAGDIGRNWNWKREERAIVAMCESWLKKRAKDPPPTEPPVRAPQGRPVADLGQERAARAKLKPVPKEKKSRLHIVLGQSFLDVLQASEQSLKFTPQGDYRYQDGLWRLDGDITHWLNGQLEIAARALSLDSNVKLIGEARAWILRHPELRVADPVAWDSHGQVPTLSGLVNPRTGELTPLGPDDHCTWRIECLYDAQATCPLWLQMLDDMFADRTVDSRVLHVQILQELLGTGLVDIKPKALSRALVLVGGSNYGKTGGLDVLSGLYGTEFNTTPLDALDTPHGTMRFIRRVPWVLHEAFDQSKWHLSSIVKAIISGDAIQINVKNGKIFSHRPAGPIFWGANSSPNFKEATAAITNRLVVLECRRKFDESRPVGTDLVAREHGFDKPQQLVLATEMAGLLAWAVAGLQRALARGYFILPEEAAAAAEAIRSDANIVAGFVADCITFDPNRMISTADFGAAFTSWWLEHKDGRGAPASERIGWALKALGEPRIATDRKDLRTTTHRFYAGVQFNLEGKRHWSNTVNSNAFVFQGRTASTSAVDADPNQMIPEDWNDKLSVRAMRAAYEKVRDRSQAPF